MGRSRGPLGALLALLLAGTGARAEDFNRAPGLYPGRPAEDAAPVPAPDRTYRNLALHRPVYQSSAFDYNLTGQLVTDGLKPAALPRWVNVATSSQGLLRREKREWILDGNWATGVELRNPGAWVQLEWGGSPPPEVDRIDLQGSIRTIDGNPENWTCLVTGSDDGLAWRPLGRASGMTRPDGAFAPSIALPAGTRCRFCRAEFVDPRARTWFLGEVAFAHRGVKVPMGGPSDFTSAWKSGGQGTEWLYVDLGAECSVDRVALQWLRRPAEGAIQTSLDASSWKTVLALPGQGGDDDLPFPGKVKARYVRVLMTRPTGPDGYLLGELEVYGRGGPLPQARPAPPPGADGSLRLTGGAWRLQRGSQVAEGGAVLSTPGYDASAWLPATVPGTILASYLNAGALPDPNFGDNQLAISDAFFCSEFWYRDEFLAPAPAEGRQAWLNFKGINWKAEVFLNGRALGRIEGGFARRAFNVTGLLRPGQANALAVRIEPNASPGCVKEKTFDSPALNGGVLGADNPTFHASIGWDWIPTIRGRNAGIWDEVELTRTGPVTLEDPSVATRLPALPDTGTAEVTLGVRLHNATGAAVPGVLRGRFGDVPFERPVTVPAGSDLRVALDPGSVPGLRIRHPRLWWPAGYGEAVLHPVELSFEAGGAVSDRRSFQAGLRQFGHTVEDHTLRLWINGRRFIPKGGNWGFSEALLRYRAREYEAAVRYHRDLHFNMIRNWVGQVGGDAFYDACDRNGIVVWQDFWLANPWDGSDPDSDALFLGNARDLVLRIRSHPCVGLYCGRNEGYPPLAIDEALRALLAAEHPGLAYLSSSADEEVSGHGPYRAQPVERYFEAPPLKLHSEMGMPDIVSWDSLRQFLPAEGLWPMGRFWGLHDFCLGGAQGGSSFLETMRVQYGTPASAEAFTQLAQFLDYDGYRAMFEAQSAHRMGLLLWMSHPAWPSLVWQTYDYYLEPTAGYFGAKKACEPLHIQYNPVLEAVEVVNTSAGDQMGLTAAVQLLNLDGSVQWERRWALDLKEDRTAPPVPVLRPVSLTPAYFLSLKLTRGTELLSRNCYSLGLEEDGTRLLAQLPRVRLDAVTRRERLGDTWRLTTRLRNGTGTPALMVHLKPVRALAGDRILPTLQDDNYIALMPGEERDVVTEVEQADTRGQAPAIQVEGFNVVSFRVPG